jgi:Eukaryotic aspartyl protease
MPQTSCLYCNLTFRTIGLGIDFLHNNTNLRNARDCETINVTSDIAVCGRSSGGVFSIDDSKTFVQVPNVKDWNVPVIDPLNAGSSVLYGYDQLLLPSNITVPRFPFEVWSNTSSTDISGLGLGSKSSVLSSFVNASVIPSPEIGLYFGSESVNNPVDGELVFGGYNSSRSTGNFSVFSINQDYETSTACPLQVLLQDILVTNDTGFSRSIFSDPAARIAACINPLQYNIVLTDSLFNNWATLTRHDNSYPDQQFELNQSGLLVELTLVFQGGYVTTIPQYELIGLERGYNDLGQWDVVNTSRLMTTVSRDVNAAFVVLGGVFLSQNYLRVDYGKGQFSLAPAVVGALSGSSNGTNNIVSTCVPGPVPTPSPTGTHSKKLSRGKIAGIAIGSAAFIALLATSIWLCLCSGSSKGKPATPPDNPPYGNFPTINTV